MTFGEKLQALRQRTGMSQDALAERLNVSRQAVSRWERDETMPETDKVVALADIFGVTTDYLLRPQTQQQTPPEDEPPRSGHAPAGQDTISRLGYLASRRPRNGRTGWSVFWPLASGNGTCWDGC